MGKTAAKYRSEMELAGNRLTGKVGVPYAFAGVASDI